MRAPTPEEQESRTLMLCHWFDVKPSKAREWLALMETEAALEREEGRTY